MRCREFLRVVRRRIARQRNVENVERPALFIEGEHGRKEREPVVGSELLALRRELQIHGPKLSVTDLELAAAIHRHRPASETEAASADMNIW